MMTHNERELPDRDESTISALSIDNDTEHRWGRQPSEIDTAQPSVSRVYDWYRGGAANFATDREFGRRVQVVLPDLRDIALCHCRFLARAVRFCAEQGIRQFLDIGSGIPDAWGTHHAAHMVNPACHVVYVDNEAVAVEVARRTIAGDDRLGVLRADLRDPDLVLDNPVTARLLDLSQPVAVVLGLVVHFIPDHDDPTGLLAHYRKALAPGSGLVFSHDTTDGREADMAEVARLYEETNRPLIMRDHATLTAMLDGFDVVEPGIVHMPLWRPDSTDPVYDRPERSCIYAAVART